MSDLVGKTIASIRTRVRSFASFLSHRTGISFVPKPDAIKSDPGIVKFRFSQAHKESGEQVSPEYFLLVKTGVGLDRLDVTAGYSDGSGQIVDQKVFRALSLAQVTPQKVFGWVERNNAKKTLSEIIGTLATIYGIRRLIRHLGTSKPHTTSRHSTVRQQKSKFHTEPALAFRKKKKPNRDKEKFRAKSPSYYEDQDPDGDPEDQAGPNNDPTHNQVIRHFPDPGQPQRDPKEPPPPSPLGQWNSNVRQSFVYNREKA